MFILVCISYIGFASVCIGVALIWIGMHWFALVYVVFVLVCIGFALWVG